MHGLGVPIVTPFDDAGEVDEATLRDVIDWIESAGADFVVPCGSSGEAPLLSADERVRVVEVVAGATDLPVLAGTGHESYAATLETTRRAAAAGAEAALVVTPSYFGVDDAALAAYYRDLADESPVPIYLYSVPKFTNRALDPRTVASLATHDDVAGIKDSSGSLESLGRLVRFTDDAEFSVLAGAASVYAAGLDLGCAGGVLAVSNVVPDLAAEVFELHRDGREGAARRTNAAFLELNHAVTTRFGVPGIKAAMAQRGQPAGPPRRPLRPVGDAVRTELDALVDEALEG